MGRTLQSYKKLFDGLKKGEPHGLYFLYGPEEFIKKEFVAELLTCLTYAAGSFERHHSLVVDLRRFSEIESNP